MNGSLFCLLAVTFYLVHSALDVFSIHKYEVCVLLPGSGVELSQATYSQNYSHEDFNTVESNTPET